MASPEGSNHGKFTKEFDKWNNRASVVVPTTLAVIGAVSPATAVVMFAGDRFILNPIEKKAVGKVENFVKRPFKKAA